MASYQPQPQNFRRNESRRSAGSIDSSWVVTDLGPLASENVFSQSLSITLSDRTQLELIPDAERATEEVLSLTD
jgi:hypothetical protein